MTRSALAGFLLLSAPALAASVPTGFSAPGEVKMFESADIVRGNGSTKGSDCAGALAAAMADIVKQSEKKGRTVVAVFDGKSFEPFASASEVTCEFKGDEAAPKGSTVKLSALAVKQGSDAAYASISGTRATEVVGALIQTNGLVDAQVNGLRIEPHKGALYLKTTGERKDTFGSENRNTRAVKIFREVITSRLAGAADYVGKVPELGGVVFVVTYKRYEGGEEKTESMKYYFPTAAAQSFAAGDLSEQGLIDAGTVMAGDVKIDISMVDAED